MPELLKSGWVLVAFGDVVRQVKDRVDPEKTDLERYVAGEHMDTDDLRIRRWGLIGDGYLGPAFHMRFKPGHVLYGSRRTYLRKVAVAHFEGITANTTFVLESKNSKLLLPELLPFIMQTESFHEHSTKQSKGSVNPYVNFSDLAWYEFALPPLEEQRKIAEALGAFENTIEAHRRLEQNADKLRRSQLLDTFRPKRGSQDSFPQHWNISKASEVGNVQLGQQRHPKFANGTNMRPYLRVANVFDGWINFDDLEAMHFPKRDLGKFELLSGDILLNEGQSTELVGRSAIYRGELSGCCFQKTLLRFRCGPSLLPEFAHAFFQHCLYTGQFARMVVQTTSMAHLTAVRFKELAVPVPPIDEQRRLSERIHGLNTASTIIGERIIASRAFVRSFIDGLWSAR